MKKILMLFMILLTACTSLQSVDINQNRQDLISQIDINERIEIQTISNEKFEMVVREISENEIIGASRRVSFDDIASIRAERVSAARTTGAVLGGYIAYVLVGVLLILSSF